MAPGDLAVLPLLKPWNPSVSSRAPGPSAHTGLLVGRAASLRAPQALPTSPWVVPETCASPFPGASWGPVPSPLFLSARMERRVGHV